MKKSNKLSVFYVLSSVVLFLALLGGGAYGLYVSVGLNFAKSSVPNIAGSGEVTNVSFGGSVNYTPSMTGIIFLSIILIVLAIIDFVLMIKQIVFFKQYKFIRNSAIEQKIEQKTKSKGMVIFWTFFIDVLCIIIGIVGLFINGRSFAGKSNFSWVFYAVDIAVSLFALLSMILLIVKLKKRKKEIEQIKAKQVQVGTEKNQARPRFETKDINQMEYNLIKLEGMKKSKLISPEEYKKLRKNILDFKSKRDNYL